MAVSENKSIECSQRTSFSFCVIRFRNKANFESLSALTKPIPCLRYPIKPNSHTEDALKYRSVGAGRSQSIWGEMYCESLGEGGRGLSVSLRVNPRRPLRASPVPSSGLMCRPTLQVKPRPGVARIRLPFISILQIGFIILVGPPDADTLFPRHINYWICILVEMIFEKNYHHSIILWSGREQRRSSARAAGLTRRIRHTIVGLSGRHCVSEGRTGELLSTRRQADLPETLCSASAFIRRPANS